MATTMATGIDKLERLFSRKKSVGRDSSANGRPVSQAYASFSASSRFASSRKGSAPNPTSPTRSTLLEDMHFPQPSFIRPKARNMVPRDEDHPPTLRPATATASRSMSVPEPPAVPARRPSLPGVAPARGGATRGLLAPPAPFTNQARFMPVATSRSTYDSRRSSLATNNTTGPSSSSGGSSTVSSSSNSTASNRQSYIDTPCEPSDVTARTAHDDKFLAGVSIQRLPKRSSSLLQRRDVYIAPLAGLSSFQIATNKRHSVAITISSGEVSPATILQSTPIIPSSTPEEPQSEFQIQSDELQDLQDLQELSGLQADNVKDLQQPLIFQADVPKDETTPEATPTQGDDLELGEAFNQIIVTEPESPKLTECECIFNETPLLSRDSVFSAIVLPQNRPTTPPASTRRRSRTSRRPMSLRYQRHLPGEPAPSSPSSVLMEPDLGDFLSLSDDDIAENVPASSSAEKKDEKEVPATATAISSATVDKALPPVKKPMELQKPLPPAPSRSSASPPVSPSRSRVLVAPSQPPSFKAPPPAFLALLPGMPSLPTSLFSSSGRPRTPAGEARMAAAFEIARIASRYQFDLAYIATIWPKNMAFMRPTSSSAASSPQSIGWPSTPPTAGPMQIPARTSSQTSCMGSRPGHASQHSQTSFVSNHSFSSVSSSRTTATNMSNHGSFAPMSPHQSKLEAQFLAAFGLATVKTPYTLSAPVHAKILNAERWFEFGESDAKPEEFGRAYGCAFYRGHAPVMTPLSQQRYQRRPSTDDCDADTEQDYSTKGRTTPRPTRRESRKASGSSSSGSGSSTANNRGIVFVAYRRKEVAEARASRQEKEDLEGLYRDVEALVDKILDVHMQQQRQAQLEAQRSTTDVEDVLASSLSSADTTSTLRQSRFLGTKATA